MLPKNYDYRPLPSYLTIKSSDIEGLGLFTNFDIEMDKLLGISHYKIGKELIRTPLGGFINHSETPNLRILEKENKYYLYTNNKIAKDSELTLNYNLYIKS